ncbi:MAG: cell division protein FtsZ [Odoribacter sp.]|nr:cell division protein FtsZ [Odoribacter sp.]
MSSYIDIEDLSGRVNEEEAPIIKVMGVGGGGSNAVNHMARVGIKNVEFIICNTDIQALRESPIKNRIQIGKDLTEGLGAGCLPEKGKNAIIESADDIRALLEKNTKVLFITAGMGGGTGTGAAPQIAKIAHEMGILTIGIVSVPFEFEGEKKLKQAMEGIDELESYVDTISIIVNDRLLDENYSVPLSTAFAMADDVLAMAAKSIADVIMMPGYINVDLRDVCTVMRDKGVALIGNGVGEGENRAIDAVKAALYSPLLKDQDIKGAAYVLIHIQYGPNEVTIQEHDDITDYVLSKVGQLTNVIWGTAYDEELGDKLRVSVVATGFNRSSINEVRQLSGSTKQPRVMRVEKKHTQSVETEFNVVPKQSDLTMKIEDSAAIEAKAREQRERKEREQAERERREQELRKRIEQEQQQNKIQNQTQDRDFQLDDDDFEAPQKGQSSKSITSAEAVDKWFKNKLGGGEGVDFELD